MKSNSHLLIVLFTLIINLPVKAQEFDNSTIAPAAIAFFQHYENADDYEECLQWLSKAIEADDTFNEAYFERAQSALKNKDFVLAEKDLTTLLNRDLPDTLKAGLYMMMAEVNLEQGKVTQAYEASIKGRNITPINTKESLQVIAKTFEALAKEHKKYIDSAIVFYEKLFIKTKYNKSVSIKLDSLYQLNTKKYALPLAEIWHGQCLEIPASDVEQSIACLQKTHDLAPDYLPAALTLSDKLYKEGLCDESLAVFAKTLAHALKNKKLLETYGQRAMLCEQHEPAITAYSALIELEPQNPEWYQWRGRHYFELENWKACLEDFAVAVPSLRENFLFYNAFGWAMEELDQQNNLKQVEKAISAYTFFFLIEHRPLDIPYYLIRVGNFKEAKTFLNEYKKSNAFEPSAYYWMYVAEVERNNGNKVAMENAYQELEKTNPSKEDWQLYIEFIQKLGNKKKAKYYLKTKHISLKE